MRRGTATIPATRRIAVFAPRCTGAVQACTREFVSGLYGRITSELELDGFTIVAGDELLATVRERSTMGGALGAGGVSVSDEHGTSAGALSVAASGSVETGGIRYDDLPPAQRRQLLADARVDGVLSLTVLVGEDTMTAPWYAVHAFEATARLSVDETPAWTSRCANVAESTQSLGGIGRSFSQAADELGRCLVAQVVRD